MKVIETENHRLCIARIQVGDAGKIVSRIGEGVQVVNAGCWKHVVFATILALRAFERGTNHARTVNGEILLRLAGTLQIAEAIREHGAQPGENFAIAYGDRCEERLMELLNELRVKELPLGECTGENLKSLFERAALVEVL